MAYQFGEKNRELTINQNLFLREVAVLHGINTPQLSKIEKGSRQLKQEKLEQLATILKAELAELQTLWLVDQVLDLVKYQPNADKALKTV